MNHDFCHNGSMIVLGCIPTVRNVLPPTTFSKWTDLVEEMLWCGQRYLTQAGSIWYKFKTFLQHSVTVMNNINISVISWRSVLLAEETGVPGENQRPVASHWQTLSHNIASSTTCYELQYTDVRVRHDTFQVIRLQKRKCKQWWSTISTKREKKTSHKRHQSSLVGYLPQTSPV